MARTYRSIFTIRILQCIFIVAIKIVFLSGTSAMSPSSSPSHCAQRHSVLLTDSFSPWELRHFLPSSSAHLTQAASAALLTSLLPMRWAIHSHRNLYPYQQEQLTSFSQCAHKTPSCLAFSFMPPRVCNASCLLIHCALHSFDWQELWGSLESHRGSQWPVAADIWARASFSSCTMSSRLKLCLLGGAFLLWLLPVTFFTLLLSAHLSRIKAIVLSKFLTAVFSFFLQTKSHHALCWN